MCRQVGVFLSTMLVGQGAASCHHSGVCRAKASSEDTELHVPEHSF